MKWWSHIAIATAPTAVLAPELVPLAVAGATAPDWLEYIAQAAGRRMPHRGPTHYGAWWAAGALGAAAVGWWPALVFLLGGLSHWLADSLTPSGVPLGPWSRARVHFFGGRIRTGSALEYMVAGAWAAAWVLAGWAGLGGEVSPWMMPWGELYRAGMLDLYEWRQWRWSWL